MNIQAAGNRYQLTADNGSLLFEGTKLYEMACIHLLLEAKYQMTLQERTDAARALREWDAQQEEKRQAIAQWKQAKKERKKARAEAEALDLQKIDLTIPDPTDPTEQKGD